MKKRLSEEAHQAIVELRKATEAREREDLIKRLEELIRRDQQRGDYAPDEESELKLAEEIMGTYVDEVCSGEATFSELKDVLRRLCIDPRHVMTIAKRKLL